MSPIPHILKQTVKDMLERFDNSYHEYSYSLDGEDMVLRSIFSKKQNGYYVDVGALHPKRFSNTYYFYRRGWRGINVDALPGSMELFKKIRPRDINLELGVSCTGEPMTLFKFNEPALNTFCEKTARKRDGVNQYRQIGTVTVPTITLERLLAQHLPKGQDINFLSVDVENFDLEVLQSNDWSSYRPAVIVVEDLASNSLQEAGYGQIGQFLAKFAYTPCCRTSQSTFFVVENYSGL